MYFKGDAKNAIGMPIELMPFNFPILGYIRGGVDAWKRAGSPTAVRLDR
eukprot:SAG11_NODE_2029_length_3902_cov_2.613463_6_plen_49_part_00